MKIFLIALIFYCLSLILKTIKSLQMLQQNRYNRGNKYLKWLKSQIKKNYLNFEILILCIPIIYYIKKELIPYFFIFLYVIVLLELINKKIHEKTKLPLKYTGRIIRLCLTTFVLYGISIFIIGLYYNSNYEMFYYLFLALISYLNNLIVVLSNIINIPIEKMVNYYFKRKAIKKLKSYSNLKVIGVTGSYGKTSSKNILNDVLNVKFNSVTSPKNYNTPFGLMITINDYLDKYNDYFIAEMGACKTKEIKELCDLVNPTYGILTKIGVAHLETFGSIENIQKTKFELIESLPKNGVGILNADDHMQVNYNLKNDCQIIWIGIDNTKKCDIYAKNICLNKNGTSFDCYFKKTNKTISFTTKLLGRANIYNILAAIALGDFLGLNEEQLKLGVKKVNPVSHRLELKSYYGMYLIDDAYNANPDGAKMALDVLKLMDGNKIVVTSGMIELGEESYKLNKEMGSYMADIANTVILIGKKGTKAIQDGLHEKKFKKENMLIFNDIMEAFEYLKNIRDKNTYILLQSDLPDIFNER